MDVVVVVSKCQYVVVNVQQCSLLHGVLYLHNDIFPGWHHTLWPAKI